MLVHRRPVTPRIKLTGTHLYNWLERGTCESKVSWPRTQYAEPGQDWRTWITRSQIEGSSLKYTAEPIFSKKHHADHWLSLLFLVFSSFYCLQKLPRTQMSVVFERRVHCSVFRRLTFKILVSSVFSTYSTKFNHGGKRAWQSTNQVQKSSEGLERG